MLKEKLLALIEDANRVESVKDLPAIARQIRDTLPDEAKDLHHEFSDYLSNTEDARAIFDILPAVKRFIDGYTEPKAVDPIEEKFNIVDALRNIEAASKVPVSLGVTDIYASGVAPEAEPKRYQARVVEFDSGAEVIECEAVPVTEPIGELIDVTPNPDDDGIA